MHTSFIPHVEAELQCVESIIFPSTREREGRGAVAVAVTGAVAEETVCKREQQLTITTNSSS